MTTHDRSECSTIAPVLQAYIDHELTGTEQERVAGHIDACSDCRATTSEQLWVRAALRSIERDRAPNSLRLRLAETLDREDREGKKDAARASSLEQAPPQPPWGVEPNQPPWGVEPNQPPWGVEPNQPPWGVEPNQPPWGVEPNQPSETLDRKDRRNPQPVIGRTRPSFGHHVWGAVQSSLKGGLAMIPAAAVGLALFFLTRSDTETPPLVVSLDPSSVADGSTPNPKNQATHLENERGIAPRPRRVELVDARIDRANSAEPQRGAQLRYRVVDRDGASGRHVIDRQRPAGGPSPLGVPVAFGGERLLLGHAEDGLPFIHFERDGVAHWVSFEGRWPQATPMGAMADDESFAVLFDVIVHQASFDATRR